MPRTGTMAHGRHFYPVACIRHHINVSVAIDSCLSRVVTPLLGHTRRCKGHAQKKIDK